MKTVTSLSSVVLWISEDFASIRLVVESALRLNEAVLQVQDLMWTFRPILATLESNWSLPGVQTWSDEFTSRCDAAGLEFLALVFDGHDPATKLLTPSKNHMLGASLRYLGSEAVLHDVAFDRSLASQCVNTIRTTPWPTPYCLILRTSGLLSPKPHVAYVPSTEVYLPKLSGARDDVYCSRGADLGSQTFNDLVKGMMAIAENAGWRTGKF